MNRQRKYSCEQVQEAVDASESIAGVLRHLGIRVSGGNSVNMRKSIDHYSIDISHFTGAGWRKGKVFSNEARPPEHYFVLLSDGSRKTDSKYLKKAMIQSGISEECILCGLKDEWNSLPLPLQIDHLNGNPLDNRRENLRFLCPNCHCQTSTWGSKRRE